MGAKDSKTASSAEKNNTKDAFLSDEKPQTRTRKHLTKNFEDKLTFDADEFPLRSTEEAVVNTYGVHPVSDGKYADQKDEAWVKFLLKKERERVQRSPAKAPVGQPKPPIKLQTSEYLKLLNSGKGTEKPKPKGVALPWAVQKPLSTDIAAAVDEIIQFRCKSVRSQSNKSPGNSPGNEEALLSIMKMFEAKGATTGVGNKKTEIAVSVPEEVSAPTAQDDLYIEKLNRDDDLAMPAYWSDDEHAPRELALASAHKLQHHVEHDPKGLREYVMQDLDPQLDHEVARLLLNSQRLTNRHKTFAQSPPVRYLVTGLKEVGRAARYGKVKCIVIAPDIEDVTANGGVDTRLHEILRTAYVQDIPVIFALSRTRMGFALGKTLKMSVLGVLETKGIQDQYDRTISLACEKRQSWNQRMSEKGSAAHRQP